MAKVKLPRYVRVRSYKGTPHYYLLLPGWAKGKLINGARCTLQQSKTLGPDLGAAILEAEKLLKIWDEWRQGNEEVEIEGSVSWLFNQYKKSKRYLDLSARSMKDYDFQMQRIIQLQLKNKTLGELVAQDIKPFHVDKIYARLIKDHGQRQASYAMQVCRTAWNVTKRLQHVSENPFSEMNISLKPTNETREWTYEEYQTMVSTARQMGLQIIATAVTLAFELVQRPGDIIGRKNKRGEIVDAARWSDYKQGQSFTIIQNKTGKRLDLPLYDSEGPLFPELEAELAQTPKLGAFIIMDPDNQSGVARPIKPEKFARLFRKVRKQAGLSSELQFKGLRHGGATELGDAEVTDIRPFTGHEKTRITKIYNKATKKKVQRGQRRRIALRSVNSGIH